MKTTNPEATKTVYPIIYQIVNVIPAQFVAEAAKAHKVLSRTFSPKSHVAAMFYCQVSKTESLNSICDIAYANESLWRSMGVTPPMRNTLSNANAHRPSGMAKDLYWRMFDYLIGIAPKFGQGRRSGFCFRIKAPMFAVDSSTIKLTMNNSFAWARHRCPKAAAKYTGTLRRIPAFVELQRKTRRHREHIVNTIRFGLNNTRIEATNNKIKLLIRVAYGFRNIDTMISLVMLFCSKIEIPWPGRTAEGQQTKGETQLCG